MSTGGKPKNPHAPWVLQLDFASHADAQTAKQMILEAFGDLFGEYTLRPKQQYPSDGNIAHWRSTHLIREALSNRSFTHEEVAKVLLDNRYNGDARKWLTNACAHKVIERIGRGEYRFSSVKGATPCKAQ